MKYEKGLSLLGTRLTELRGLLSIRDHLHRDVSTALSNSRTADHVGAMGRSEAEAKFSAHTMSSTSRHRSAMTRVESEVDLIRRLVNVEKAKQMAATIPQHFPIEEGSSNIGELLLRLDDMKRIVKHEKLRHSSRRVPLMKYATISQHIPPVKAFTQKPQLLKTLIRSTSTSSRTNARTVPPPIVESATWFQEESENKENDVDSNDEHVIEAERMNPLKLTERKRAQLAAIKLKRNRL